jgi:hypothetical protein
VTRWLLFLLLFINSTCTFSQTNLKRDSSYIESRSFNNTAINELKNNRDFQYNKYREPPLSLWDKFWNWFWWKIGQLIGTKSGRITVWSILIFFAIAVVIYFVVKVTGMDQNGLFGRRSKVLQNYGLSQNDIHNISFDSEIERAISVNNYRLATRLQYLQALKNLSDKGHIEWRINKTNTDYISEIHGKPFRDMFSALTFNFEYIWYGEKQVTRERFLELKHQFQQFYNQV